MYTQLETNGNYLIHYGTPRHSGRFPYGSGEKPFQGLPSYKRSVKLKEKAAELKRLSKSTNDSEEASKYLKRAERLAEKSERLNDKAEYKYAKDYAKQLNRAKKASDAVFDKSTGKIADLAGERKLLSAKTVAQIGLAASSIASYEMLRNKAVKDIPNNTNYALELVNGKYRVRDKYSAAGINTKPVTEFTKGDYTIKSKRGIANLAGTALKTGLDTFDTIHTNQNYAGRKEKIDLKKQAEAKAADRINRAEAKAITIRAKGEAQAIVNKSRGASGKGNQNQPQAISGKKIAKAIVNTANAMATPIAVASKATRVIRGKDKSGDKLDKILAAVGKYSTVAIPLTQVSKAVTDNL